jgi:hypothetical protein
MEMATDTDALNYPYIRIRDVDWLKRTLLIFPHVVRITPEVGAPRDEPEVAEFAGLEGRRGPLLRRARLRTDFVHKAQEELIRTIQQQIELDSDTFLSVYGKYGTMRESSALIREAASLWDDRLLGRPFQLHGSKLLDSLQQFLWENNLAWQPQRPHAHGYVEMHPRLGEAVMATLAFACAENEGLQLVTEFPGVYGRTIRLPKEDLLTSCLSPSPIVEPGAAPDAAEVVAEFIVYQRCDPRKLTPERLQALNKEWQPVADFREAVEKIAKSIPSGIRDQQTLKSYLNDAADRVFTQWQRDQVNLSTYARELFGEGILSEPGKALSKVAEKAFGGTATGALVAPDMILGAATGCAIGLIFHAVNSYRRVSRKEEESPLRYLTMLQSEGVGFVVSV